jgi:Family of unknown function (DUF6325)
MSGDEVAPPARDGQDLVSYLVLAVPDTDDLGAVVPALASLVERDVIRILDLAVVVRERNGSVVLLEVDAVDGLEPLLELDGEYGYLLTERDLGRVAASLAPASTAFVIVAEDRWAEPLSAAAHQVGGTILAGERIPTARLHAAFVERGAPAHMEER